MKKWTVAAFQAAKGKRKLGCCTAYDACFAHLADAAGIPCEILTYDWSTFVQIRNNEPENYNAFITSFSPKTVPSMNLYLSSGWAGWCTDEHIQTELQRINASINMEEGVAIWRDLQEYMWSDYMPVVNLGIQNVFMISSAEVQDLGYFERITYVNAHF